jgi:hypothetical protein
VSRRSLLGAVACCVAVLAAAMPAHADVVDDGPAVAAQGVGDMRVFIRGSDGALWTRSWNGTAWTSWSSLGGVLTSGPAVTVRPNGIYDIVVRGPANAYSTAISRPSAAGATSSRSAAPSGRRPA